MANRTLAELDREWALIESAPRSVRALARWRDTEPALAGCTTLGDVLVERTDPEAAPAVLAALARRAGHDELAARTLFQALVPGMIGLATGPLAGNPAALNEVISLAWERIRTYPTWRPGSVAANVLRDVRKGYREHRRIEASADERIATLAGTTAPSAEDVALRRSWVGALADAHRSGAIGDVGVDLIFRTRVEGHSLAEVAADHHASVEWANCVRWRAECRLRPALAEAG
jgi:hypothetical protein